MNAETMIEFRNVDLGYGRKKIVSNLNWSISRGDFLGIVGPNGAGKTTILRSLLGILKPLQGDIAIKPVNGPRLRFGYVPQRDTINPVLPYTVHDIVMMGRFANLGLFNRPGKTDRALVDESLEHVDIQDIAHLPFKELSGGQKQRTLIARALVVDPDMLVLDEPTNGMDLSSRFGILNLIQHFHEEHHMTIVMVSHLLNDVANYVQRIALVDENFFKIDTVEAILTDSNLTEFYNLEVKVGDCSGVRFIATGGKSV